MITWWNTKMSWCGVSRIINKKNMAPILLHSRCMRLAAIFRHERTVYWRNSNFIALLKLQMRSHNIQILTFYNAGCMSDFRRLICIICFWDFFFFIIASVRCENEMQCAILKLYNYCLVISAFLNMIFISWIFIFI